MVLIYNERAALDVEAILSYWVEVRDQPRQGRAFLDAFLTVVESIKSQPTGQFIESLEAGTIFAGSFQDLSMPSTSNVPSIKSKCYGFCTG